MNVTEGSSALNALAALSPQDRAALDGNTLMRNRFPTLFGPEPMTNWDAWL